MGNNVTRSLCTGADDTAASKGAAARLFTYVGVPLDALVAYERAALRLSHNLDCLRRSAAEATASAVVRAAASTPTGRDGSKSASQPPRRPLLQLCVDVQNVLQQQCAQQQPLCHTGKDKTMVAGESAYQDGVPVLLQELAWEWRSSTSRERRGRASSADRPPALRAEEMATWNIRTTQLLQGYVRSRRFEKALRHARKVAVTNSGSCPSATVAPQKGRASSGGAPPPRVFRELFKSYAVLGRSLTQPRRSGGRGAPRSSAAHFPSDVTPSMWCALLCQFLRALPGPLIPSLCGRRLEPLAGAPSSRPTSGAAPASVTRAAHAAMRRVVEESFISTNAVAYTTLCYVLHLVQEHRAELTGDEVETVAQAVVRESSLSQLTREVAHACKPEVRLFWPPPVSAGASSKAAPAAARAHRLELRRGGRRRSSSLTGVTSSSITVSAPLQGTAAAAAAVKAQAATGATAMGCMTAAQHGGGTTPPSGGDTSSCVSSDCSAVEGAEIRGGGIGDGSGSDESAAGGGAANAQGRLAGAKGAAHLSVSATAKTPTASTTHAAAVGGMQGPATSPSSATISEGDDGESERCPPAVAACGLSVAAQPTEGARHALPVPQQDSLRTGAAAESHPKLQRKERCMTSSAAPFSTSIPPASGNNSPAPEHCPRDGQQSIKRTIPLSEDDGMRLLSMPASRQELTALDISKLNSALDPSELEDLGAMEAEAEALRCALQRFSKPSPAAATSSRGHDGDSGGRHARTPEGESGSQQSAVIGSVSACWAPVPPRLPLLSSSHGTGPTSTSSARHERHLMPRCSSAAAAAPAIARPPPSPSLHLKPSPSAQESAARLPAMAYRALAEQPLLTALMVAKQRFLAAQTMTPRDDSAVAPSPPHAAACVGWTAARGDDSSGNVADHRLERVMTCAREMGWTSLESLIESLKAANLHSHGAAAAVSEAEAAPLSTPHPHELKPEALGSSSNAPDVQGWPQPRGEVPHHARGRVVADAPIPRLMRPSSAFSRDDPSITHNRSAYDRESRQPHAPQRGADSHRSSLSPEAEIDDSAMRSEVTLAFGGSGVLHARPQGAPLPSSPTADNGRVAGTGHEQLGAPLQSHGGHTSSSLTTPLTMTTLSTIATAGAATAQPLSGLDQELEKLRRLVRTLESRQFVQARQSSAQTSELTARCAELQHQQLEQEKQLRLACARLLDVGNLLEELRSVKTCLQGQLMASRQEGTRLRDALLLGETRR
ncbi:hypothetical protein JIQ42_04489 [Leishmania sp. Namibia]|uniref:hypothetical protein n=1 Tax=Leishmania sp. Namibia TaxID=2802991 RepID=UPI001B5F6CA5|nr:hypothetical protein JIQ42_04489 [Leishmania sp. Namibia]